MRQRGSKQGKYLRQARHFVGSGGNLFGESFAVAAKKEQRGRTVVLGQGDVKLVSPDDIDPPQDGRDHAEREQEQHGKPIKEAGFMRMARDDLFVAAPWDIGG